MMQAVIEVSDAGTKGEFIVTRLIEEAQSAAARFLERA